jgi:hypothetical protein
MTSRLTFGEVRYDGGGVGGRVARRATTTAG